MNTTQELSLYRMSIRSFRRLPLSLILAALVLPGTQAMAERITGTFRYADFDPVAGTSQLRPIQFCKVEVNSFRPRFLGIWSWGNDTNTTTDQNGAISVVVPFQMPGIIYGVRVYSQNYGAVVWPNSFGATSPFSQEPGQPDNAIINRAVISSGDVLNFSYNFTDSFTPQHWNIADAVRRGWDFVSARRDPRETDPLPPAPVQPGFALSTFYNPVNTTMEIQNQFVWDDLTLLHEFAHFVEHQISHFVAIPSFHDGCTTRDVFQNIINTPEHAWMEGFAEFFAQAVVAKNPPGTFQGPGNGTFSASSLENSPWSCAELPASVPPAAIENVVAGVLWDVFDEVGACGTSEAHDELQGFDTQIIQIMDRELDLPQPPTIGDFHSAWVSRGLPVVPWVNILRRYGLSAPLPPPTLITPGDLTVAASANTCSAVVTYAAPFLNLPHRCATISSFPASGSTFSVGTTRVDSRAIENGQVIATASFNVTVTPSASLPNPNGTGLLGVYYDRPDFTEPRVARTEAVDFDWGLNSPAPGVAPDTFSVRWSGKIVPRYSGVYRLFTVSDDGIRLWIDGFPLINAWFDQGPTEFYGDYTLEAGRAHDIVIEMYENGGGAVARLLWQSACQPKEPVPVTHLLPAPIDCPTPGRPTFAANFLYGQPSGMTLFGSAVINGGWLKLTTPTTPFGIAYIDNFSGSQPVSGFEARFKTALFGSACCGNGAFPADGFSFNLVPAATVLPNPDYGQPGEEGLDQGLAVNFDTWDNGGGEGPAIEVKWLGQVIARQAFQPSQSPMGAVTAAAASKDTRILLESDGRMSVDYGGVRVLDQVQTPYTPQLIGAPKWVIGARTGGANDNHWIRDLSIVVNRASIPGLFSTGVDNLRHPLPDNASDPHYTNPHEIIVTLPWVARASGGFPIGPWLPDNDASAWISVSDTTLAPPNVDMEYATSFDLRGLDPSTAAIHGWVAADNELVDIRINGVSTGVHTPSEVVGAGDPFTSWQAIAITSGFRPGANTLSFIVRNGAGGDNPSGLRTQLYGWGTPPTLMKLNLAYTGRGTTVTWGSLPHKRYYFESAASPAGPWVRTPASGVDSGGYQTQINQFFFIGQRPVMQFYRVSEVW